MPLREGMPTYRNNPPYRRIVDKDMQKGDVANQSRFEFGAHCGTHIDAPFHFVDGGYTTDKIPFDALIGPARVMHFDGVDAIDAGDLENRDWEGVERVLFRTRNSDHWKAGGAFDIGYVYVTGPGARFLVEKKLKLVGIDSLGIEQPGTKDYPAHTAILGAGIPVLEGLCLADVPPGDYRLFCGPLRIEGGDGAPARVFLES